MVEIFQGNKDEVKREANEWFAANPGIGIEHVLQDVTSDPRCLYPEITITVVYEPPYYDNTKEERALEAMVHG